MLLDNTEGISAEDLFEKANAQVTEQEAAVEEQNPKQEEQVQTETNESEEKQQNEDPKTPETTEKKEEAGAAEEDEEVKKQNAFASISKKLKESKDEANKEKAAREAAELQVKEYKEKLAKAQGVSVEELDKKVEDLASKETGLTPEARAEIEKSRAETNAAKEELREIKLGQGIQKLLDLGGEEEAIIAFLDNSKTKYGVDLKDNPNLAMIENFWKAENADALIQRGVQEALSTKKKEIVVNTGDTRQNAEKTDGLDDFTKQMLEVVKNI